MSPIQLLSVIQTASFLNNRYLRSYWSLFKKIFEEYRPNQVENINPLFDYFIYKEYGIILIENHKKSINDFELKNLSLEVYQENTIYNAIMNNDIKSLILFTEDENFDKDQVLESDYFPDTLEKYINDKSNIIDDFFEPWIYFQYTLLDICCYYGAVDCFKLLRSKFNSEITETCLHFSFLSGNPDIMNECLKYQKPDETCMEYAIMSHNIDFITYLMNGYNLKIDLNQCCKYNNYEAFFVYLDQTNDINSCFIYSIVYNIPILFRYFLSHGANVNVTYLDNPLIIYTVMKNYKEFAELLVAHGAYVNAKNIDNRTALHYAAKNNNKELAEILILNGTKVNERDKDGETPLHWAAENNSKETAEFLISCDADVNMKDNYQRTALHLAARNNCKEMTVLLIIHGAEINAKNELGRTPLHYTAENNSKETAEILISHRADINLKDINGWTVLHHAVYYMSQETIEVLVSHGININAKSAAGLTALIIAKNCGFNFLVTFLKSNGAK
ncbi:ankyrin repeat protein, putative [Trichomonas vaginalis G3]|uniref:Ankyrin repeat protein, putative n=1 Tax=Trichomonas vaginalis (strain ATCC PRA-98 / G3) TaxID=412133 RepID=A2E1R1_TRIV3|nr:ankyrin repeat and SOCS box-containing protein 4 family [Trichomonas vaginalis G3]EAY13390.1 ankyrin repeat protein, putative [Trichomonas vaginalis G3]KAI5528143.1 ankyrin repeat and SOCS box-containing protein 4 family [Trichomonas vaginalis G3]|eukprot:XP_001325613.1 ankyrin repeat protein [Trichomonas vaginalis G3]